MMTTDPSSAIQGAQVGGICDQGNCRIRNGDEVRVYATVYPKDGWTLRRLWCTDCGPETVDPGTADTDEVVAAAVWWHYRLAAVRILDRSLPEEGDPA